MSSNIQTDNHLIDFTTERVQWENTDNIEGTILVSIQDIYDSIHTTDTTLKDTYSVEKQTNFTQNPLLFMAYAYLFKVKYGGTLARSVTIDEFKVALGFCESTKIVSFMNQMTRAGYLKFTRLKKRRGRTFLYNIKLQKDFKALGKFGVKYRIRIPSNRRVTASELHEYFRYLLFLNEMHKQDVLIQEKQLAFDKDVTELLEKKGSDVLTKEEEDKFRVGYKNFIPYPTYTDKRLGYLLKIDRTAALRLKRKWIEHWGWLKKGKIDVFQRLLPNNPTDKDLKLRVREYIDNGAVWKTINVYEWKQNLTNYDDFMASDRVFKHDKDEFIDEQRNNRNGKKQKENVENIESKVDKLHYTECNEKLFVCQRGMGKINIKSVSAEAYYFINPKFYGRIIYEKLTEWEKSFFDTIKHNIYGDIPSWCRTRLSTA